MTSYLIVTWTAPFMFEYGGASVVAKNLAYALSTKGDVFIYGYGAREFTCVKHGRIRSCNLYTLQFNDLKEYNREVDMGNLKLLEACWETGSAFDAAFLLDYHGAMCSMALHGKIPTLLYLQLSTPMADTIASIPYVTVLAFNSKLLATTYYGLMQRYLTGLFEKLGLARRTAVIYPATPAGVARVRPKDIYRDLFQGYDYVVGILTRKDTWKNLEIVPALAEKLKEKKIALILAGIGVCGQKGYMGENLYCLGQVHDSEKNEFLSSVDATLLISHFESFGLTALESVACGTPVAMSRYTGVAEVLPGEKFDPHNVDDIVRATVETLRRRDDIIAEQRNSWIARRTYMDLAREMLDALTQPSVI